MIEKPILFAIGALIFAIGSNMFVFRYTIRRAVKRHVIPLMEGKGLAFVKYKWVGFFNFGDFKKDVIEIRPSMSGGNPFHSIYVYIFYNEAQKEKKVTIRIDTFFMFIRRIVYSKNL